MLSELSSAHPKGDNGLFILLGKKNYAFSSQGTAYKMWARWSAVQSPFCVTATLPSRIIQIYAGSSATQDIHQLSGKGNTHEGNEASDY